VGAGPEDIDLPVFSLNVTGELRIVNDEISQKRYLGRPLRYGKHLLLVVDPAPVKLAVPV
jgi:hypothetical protein